MSCRAEQDAPFPSRRRERWHRSTLAARASTCANISVPGAIAPPRGRVAKISTCVRIAWFSCTSICPQRSSPKVHRSASISPVSAGNCPSSQCVNASADCRIGWYSSRAIPSSGLGVRVTFGGIISASFFINGERLSNIEPSRSHNNITTMPCPVNGGF